MKSNWNYPTTVWVGKDRIKDLGEACHNLKINNPLFVTDKDLVNLPFIKEMISEVKKDEISYADSPTKFEAGTMQTAEVVSFSKSIKFIQDLVSPHFQIYKIII